MAEYLNSVRFRAGNTGTSAFEDGTADVGFLNMGGAGAVHGATYSYRAETPSRSQWENGRGVYNSATGTLSRDTIYETSMGSGSTINFTTAPYVNITPLRLDLDEIVTNHVAEADPHSQYSTTAETNAAAAAAVAAHVAEADPHPQYSTTAETNAAAVAAVAAQIGVTVQAHSAVLDATTASFTTADETKLDGIAAGATAVTLASEAEALAGTSSTVAMTPERARQAISSHHSVATIAALQALTSTPAREAVYVREYHAGTNKGGGWFHYISTDTTTADDGFITIVDAAGRRWKRDISAGVDAYMAGAKGDTVVSGGLITSGTDDTAALQKVLDYVRTQVVWAQAQQATVRASFGAGIFRVTSLNGTGIAGGPCIIDGRGATLACNTERAVVFDLVNSNRVSVRDLNIFGAESGTIPAVGIRFGSNDLLGHAYNSLFFCHSYGSFRYAAACLSGSEIFREMGCLWQNSINSDKAYAFAADTNNYLQWEAPKSITSATAGNPTTITTSTSHFVNVGDVVMMTGVGGATALNNVELVVLTRPSATTFTVGVDGTGYTSGGLVFEQRYPNAFTSAVRGPWTYSGSLNQVHIGCQFAGDKCMAGLLEGGGSRHTYINCAGTSGVFDDEATSDITITSLTAATSTIVTSAVHGLIVGDWIWVKGTSVGANNNRVLRVATVPTTTSITVQTPTLDPAGLLDATGGTLHKQTSAGFRGVGIHFHLLKETSLSRQDNCHYDIRFEVGTANRNRRWALIDCMEIDKPGGVAEEVFFNNCKFHEVSAEGLLDFMAATNAVSKVYVIGGEISVPQFRTGWFGGGENYWADRLLTTVAKWHCHTNFILKDEAAIGSLAAISGEVFDTTANTARTKGNGRLLDITNTAAATPANFTATNYLTQTLADGTIIYVPYRTATW